MHQPDKGLNCLYVSLLNVSLWTNDQSKIDKTKIFITNGILMKVECKINFEIHFWSFREWPFHNRFYYISQCMKGSLTVWALYAYISDSQNAAFELLVWYM